MNKESFFLIFVAFGVFPVSLIYGGHPAISMPYFYGIEVNTINLSNILRAIMGLYIALCVFWVIGARYEKLRLAALWSLVIFMIGIASGRILSLVLDGMPSSLFIFYTFVEIMAAIVGIKLINDKQKG
ncbi:MAG: hypothetical protein CMD63_03005 [Gammaproteobacteria bacterium]|nr:hypothetical protein [Gammaproteobacteria bacterium]|tara:strand:- start:785 stop:1168 length:384 start_codon:yes stop_codon:yes gene_type:complete